MRQADFAGAMRTTFEAMQDHVVAVIHIGPNQTIGLRFLSPEHIAHFASELIEKATEVWPENELIQYYLDDTEE